MGVGGQLADAFLVAACCNEEARLTSVSRASKKAAATYSPTWWGSTIGDCVLNFSVRNGKRCDHTALPPHYISERTQGSNYSSSVALTALHQAYLSSKKALGPLVQVSSTRYRACTSCLSTWSSPTTLCGSLILKTASRLDAFSAYPDPAWVPGDAAGATTGMPEAGPTRSSRTKVSPSQTSCAHNR